MPLTRWRRLAIYKSLATNSLQSLQFDGRRALAIAAWLVGTLLYGHAASYAKRYLPGVPAMVMAAGTQIAATAALAVPAALTWPAVTPSARDWQIGAALAVLACWACYRAHVLARPPTPAAKPPAEAST